MVCPPHDITLECEPIATRPRRVLVGGHRVNADKSPPRTLVAIQSLFVYLLIDLDDPDTVTHGCTGQIRKSGAEQVHKWENGVAFFSSMNSNSPLSKRHICHHFRSAVIHLMGFSTVSITVPGTMFPQYGQQPKLCIIWCQSTLWSHFAQK